MKKTVKKLKLDYFVSAILMIAMVIVVFTQVVFRIAGHPLSWPDEVSRWLLIWITFAGTSYSFKNGGLISVDFFVNRYLNKNKKIFDILSMSITGVFFAILMCSGVTYSIKSVISKQYASVTRIPLIFSNISVVIGSFLSLVHCTKNIRNLIIIENKQKYAKN